MERRESNTQAVWSETFIERSVTSVMIYLACFLLVHCPLKLIMESYGAGTAVEL